MFLAVSQTPKRPNSQPRPWEQGSDADAVSFGTWLRRQREMRDINLREIADATKISVRYLDALEQDRFELLPAAVFARGFLREYSRYVGISPDEAVNYFLSAQGHDQDEVELPANAVPALPRRRRDWLYGATIVVGLLALLGVVTLLAVLVERRSVKEGGSPSNSPAVVVEADSEVEPTAVALPATPLAAVPLTAPVAVAAKAALRVEMEFTGRCWIERVIDEGDRLSELRVAGEALTLEGERSIVLTLGDASVVRVHVNGRPFPLRPDSSRVVRDLRIDLQSLEPVEGSSPPALQP